MKRRDFIALIGGAAAVPSPTARAQQSALPIVGFINGGSPEGLTRPAAAHFAAPLMKRGSSRTRTSWSNTTGSKATMIAYRPSSPI
jgi:hypothetical protein